MSVSLTGCISNPPPHTISDPPAPAEVTFEQHEIVTGAAGRQTVVTGFLLGGAVSDVAVLSIDEHDDRRVRIYAFGDGGWSASLDATLGPDVMFVDVANIGGRDRLLTYEPGRLSWFDPHSATARDLVAVTASYVTPRRDEIPHVDVTRDLNRDGRDDLVVPGGDGFRVFVQTSAGAFADPVEIGRPAEGVIPRVDGYRYDPWSRGRVHEVDGDQDGRVDLVFWNEDHFEVHRQDEQGRFDAASTSVTTDVAFDSDVLATLATGDMVGRVLYSLTDLSGDGVADVVVLALEGRTIATKRSTFEVHFGTPTSDDGVVWAPVPDAVFEADDAIQLGMDRHDFDRDGQVDVMLTTIEVGYLTRSLWKRIKGFMGDDLWLDLAFYRREGRFYPDQPNAIRRIALDGTPSYREPGWVPLDVVLLRGVGGRDHAHESYPRVFNRTLLVGDVTGDARSDLLIEWTHRELHLFVGVPGPGLFAQRPQRIAVALPNDTEYTWLVDLDRDGRQDILLHHPFTLRDAHGAPRRPPGTEPHRVVTLLAR